MDVSFEQMVKTLEEGAKQGEPGCIAMLCTLAEFYPGGDAVCPLCERRTTKIGGLAVATYALKNGKIRVYAYILCGRCMQAQERASQKKRNKYATKIEQFFERQGLFDPNYPTSNDSSDALSFKKGDG